MFDECATEQDETGACDECECNTEQQDLLLSDPWDPEAADHHQEDE